MSSSCWPDHDEGDELLLDDVSRLSATLVARLVMPLTPDDVFDALEWAQSRGVTVAARGTKHSMGGHSISPHGLSLDMQHVNAVSFDPASQTCRCGAGALWADVIVELNRFGKAPRTLQSYCTFSVGGSISVNAHGITSDCCLGESVVSVTVLRLGPNGERETVVAERGSPLLSCVVGGYGLFGIVWDAVVTVTNNRPVQLEVMHLTAASFPPVYTGVLQDESVAMKLARIDITNFEHIALYVFRSDSPIGSVSDLPAVPREMSVVSQLIYKWLAGPLLELRFEAERALGLALDWAPVATVNQLLFESATPLAQLYSPLLAFDDTFILQEYFVPANHFGGFFNALKRVVLDMRAADSLLVTLLNVTIRFVRKDCISLLPYATSDSFAFVLYYRLRRTDEAVARLRCFHEALGGAAADFGGTFYLPYRFHYSLDEMRHCYPSFAEFAKQKQARDPKGLFSNTWWEFVSSAKGEAAPKWAANSSIVALPKAIALTFDLTIVSVHRSDSFRTLMANGWHRRQFAEDFLVNTFNNMSPKVLMGYLYSVCYDVRNQNDNDIYLALQERLSGSGSFGKLFFLLASIKQLAAQRAELTREVKSIVTRLNMLNQLHDLVSIGDNGK